MSAKRRTHYRSHNTLFSTFYIYVEVLRDGMVAAVGSSSARVYVVSQPNLVVLQRVHAFGFVCMSIEKLTGHVVKSFF